MQRIPPRRGEGQVVIRSANGVNRPVIRPQPQVSMANYK